MLAPQDSNRVKNALANEMASRFAEMSIDEFVVAADTNLAKVKLDTPAVWVKVGLKSGATHELKGTRILDGYSFVQHPSRKDTIKLSSWRFDSFKKKPFELLESPPPDTSKTAGAANGGIKIETAAHGPTAAKPAPAHKTPPSPAKAADAAATLQVKPAPVPTLKADTSKAAAPAAKK